MVFDLYSKLAVAFGPSGREEEIRTAIGVLAADYCDDMYTDALGNLICRKKATDANHPTKKVMLAAHMDSIGMVATHIDDNGFLRFAPIGGLSLGDLIHRRIRFANGTRGVIATEEKTPFKELTAAQCYIDIGATDATHAKTMVSVGDFAVYDADIFTQGDVICGPYMDNRMGCVTLLLAMQQLQPSNNEVYFVFTVQEEVGLRGATTAAFQIQPDIALAVDVTDTADLPAYKYPMDVHMGKGAAIKVMDKSVICAPAVVQQLEACANELSLTVQHEILQFGGTDTAVMQKSGMGALAGAVSIPTRHIHSPCEMVAQQDVADAAQLVALFATK